jgi:LEA14-like dessication related protein
MGSRSRIWLLCLGLVLSGCTYLRHMVGLVAEKPEVKLTAVDVKSFSVKKIDLVFVLDVFNPNRFSLDLDRLDYAVHGLGLALGVGSMTDAIHLKAESRSEVRLPLTLDPDAAVQLMKNYMMKPRDLKLKLTARLFLDTAFGKMDVNFEEEKLVLKGLSNP